MDTECVVCGRSIDSEDPSETGYGDETVAPAQVEYDGKTYLLCRDSCRRTFEEDPEAYV